MRVNKDLTISRYNRICQLCMNIIMKAVLLPAASLFVLAAIESVVLGRWTKYIVPVIFLFHTFFKFVTLTWRNRVRDQNFFGKLRKMQNPIWVASSMDCSGRKRRIQTEEWRLIYLIKS